MTQQGIQTLEYFTLDKAISGFELVEALEPYFGSLIEQAVDRNTQMGNNIRSLFKE